MKKFEITEDQIKELAKGNKKVEKMFPEAFETKLEIGKWYRNIDYNGGKMIAYVSEIHETDVWSFKGYGFCVDGSWSKIGKFGAKKWKLATEEEVKSALIKEAERRGFKIGASFICLIGCKRRFEKFDFWNLKRDVEPEKKFNISGVFGDGGVLFREGIWAEVVKTKYLTKNKLKKN